MCTHNMFNNCESLNPFCEYWTQTVQASVEGQRSLAPLSSFSSLIGYCACLLRVRRAQAVVALLVWHTFPLAAAANHCRCLSKVLVKIVGLCAHTLLCVSALHSGARESASVLFPRIPCCCSINILYLLCCCCCCYLGVSAAPLTYRSQC